MNCVLGIDTSCYTTSVAIMDENMQLVADVRRLLKVAPGKRGLAQSEMVFQHTRNLPQLIEEAIAVCGNSAKLTAVGVSGYPRPLPDSYMPAFLVGDGYARVLAAVNGINLHRVSHQEGHIFAGIWSAKGPNAKQFLALHVSGGTTELVKVRQNSDKINIELLGGSLDLHAGQFIDRVGVALQLPFPAGSHLEKAAEKCDGDCSAIPSSVQGLDISFSGPETHTMRLLSKGANCNAVAAGVQKCVAESLTKLIINAVGQTELKDILIVGGVSSNMFIRQYINNGLSDLGVSVFYPDKKYCTDNAVGTAFFARNH